MQYNLKYYLCSFTVKYCRNVRTIYYKIRNNKIRRFGDTPLIQKSKVKIKMKFVFENKIGICINFVRLN